jgi:uncharacterized ferritin-like protein (DUF455 family)
MNLSPLAREVLLCADPPSKLNFARQCAALVAESATQGDSLGGKIDSLRNSAYSENLERKLPFDVCSLESLPQELARPTHFELRPAYGLPKRRSIRDKLGFAQLLHALAHIELVAIEIDAAMLFLYHQGPVEWKTDLSSIMLDECLHFELICDVLQKLGMSYGDLPVHFALWEGFLKGKTWLEHLLIATRYQESSGIDAAYFLLERMAKNQDVIHLKESQSLIQRILGDEERHVSIGSKWWHWAYQIQGWGDPPCDQKTSQDFLVYLERNFTSPWSKRFPFYLEGRRRAGFRQPELQFLDEVAQGKIHFR